MSSSKGRLFYIDNLKAFLILTVIFGHCIQQYDVDFDNNPLFRFIYSFHMPLFFFVSGFLSYKAVLGIRHVTKRFVQLIIPFLAWGLYSCFRFGTMSMLDIILTPDTGLWFLWVLFLIYTVTWSINVLSRRLKVKEELLALTAIPVLYILGYKVNACGVSLVAWYYPFFIGGYFLKKYQHKIADISDSLLMVVTVAFLFLALFWHRTHSPAFIGVDNKAVLMGYKLITALLGIIAIFGLFKRYVTRNRPIISKVGGVV